VRLGDRVRRLPFEDFDKSATRGLHQDRRPVGHQSLRKQTLVMVPHQHFERGMLPWFGPVGGNDDAPHVKTLHPHPIAPWYRPQKQSPHRCGLQCSDRAGAGYSSR
jgi:hypothetical protein